jgi:hypothetical protein
MLALGSISIKVLNSRKELSYEFGVFINGHKDIPFSTI